MTDKNIKQTVFWSRIDDSEEKFGNFIAMSKNIWMKHQRDREIGNLPKKNQGKTACHLKTNKSKS